MKNKKGFTMVELMIAFSIVGVLAVMATGILNPTVLANRGQDVRRKKDVRAIGIAFEEYFNDKGQYPTQAEIDAINCKADSFIWLKNWPCDPTGPKYIIQTTPKSYRIMTNLSVRTDKDIPAGWYDLAPEAVSVAGGTLTTNQVNFGVTSQNTTWYETGYFPATPTPAPTTTMGGRRPPNANPFQ